MERINGIAIAATNSHLFEHIASACKLILANYLNYGKSVSLHQKHIALR